MWPPTRPMVGVRGLSSVGRALPLQGRSQGFESPRLHKCDESGHGLHMSRVIGYRFPGQRPGFFVWLRQ